MTPIPADLGQRILDAARIAAALHEQGETLTHRGTLVHAGGAGRVGLREDAQRIDPISTDGAVTSRPRAWWSRFR